MNQIQTGPRPRCGLGLAVTVGYDGGMKFQFTVARLLRSIVFFAVGCWALVWIWQFKQGLHSYGATLALVCAPAAIGGAVGALFGKDLIGIFCGLVVLFACPFLAEVWIGIIGWPFR
jgi:hypothetical protein